MKIISWNCNGLRSVLNKNALQDLLEKEKPDILCLQETKCPTDLKLDMSIYNLNYHMINDSKVKKGYSGVAIFANIEPVRIITDFSENQEGRVIVFEYPKYYIMNSYVPNSKADLSRLDYRIDTWEFEVRKYINELQKTKPVIALADWNVVPHDIDIYSTKGKAKMHGNTVQEKKAFQDLLTECKMIDSYRLLYPEKREYTWFSNFGKAREKNNGWRIDTALVSEKLKSKITDAGILKEYTGSDHVPVSLEINI